MGAVTFSLDRKLVETLKISLNVNTLVETGTFNGDTVASLHNEFDRIYSIELSDELFAKATKRFEGAPNVSLLHGDSPCILRELKDSLCDSPVLYWLDAHWCASDATAGSLSQCPLIGELEAIGRLNINSAVLIDDARLFMAPPLAPHEISQWPSFNQIIRTLFMMSPDHEIMVVNDVIAFFPKDAKLAMQTYAQLHGFDWLTATSSMKEHGSLMRDLVEKENVLQELSSALNAYKAALEATVIKFANTEEPYRIALEAKEKVIQQQKKALARIKLYLFPVFFLEKSRRRFIEIIRPRLGNLYQYPPRALNIRGIGVERKITNHPRISIVTPSYGQGSYIEHTLLSILEQKYPNLEYFVQDGGSTDNTVEVLKKYQSQLSGWVSEKDSGQSQAINLGLSKTKGEIMAWLNSDDLLLPGTLNTVAEFFNRNPEIDVVYGNRLLIDENGMDIGRWILPGHDGSVLSWADYIPQETLFWRRRVWDKVGGHVDESFRFAMDWDLLVRFRDAGAKFAHIPQYLGAFRIHAHQKTSASINEIGKQEMDRIRERLLGRIPSRKEIHKAVLPYMVRHIVTDLKYRAKIRMGFAV